jgi:nitroreductase
MTLQKALDWRYAVQKFDPKKKLSAKKLNTILDAARKAPSSHNFQPWKIILVEDPDLRMKIQAVGYGQPKITEASHLVVIASRTEVLEDDAHQVIQQTVAERNLPEETAESYAAMVKGSIQGKDQAALAQWAKRQSYIALGFLLLAAALEEVDAGPMEGFLPDKVDQILGLEEMGYTSATMVALGYRSPDDHHATMAKVRFGKDKVIIKM